VVATSPAGTVLTITIGTGGAGAVDSLSFAIGGAGADGRIVIKTA
jgi:hypothetical protein